MAGLSLPSNQSGIMTWISSIRTTMANDPGRQMLEDQIQTDGFLFLEDYLESILVKPRHDPIIELIKTPARRRNVPKKLKSATTAALKGKLIVTTDLEEVDSDKENEAPLYAGGPNNELHEVHSQSEGANLSRLRERAGTHATSSTALAITCESSTPKKPVSESNAATVTDVASENARASEEVDEDEKSVKILITPPRSKAFFPHSQEVCPPKPFTPADWVEPRLDPSRTELVAELSVIEEGDEPAERSNHSIAKRFCEDLVHASDNSMIKSAGSPKPYPKKALPAIDMATVMDIDDVTQTMNFGNALGSEQSSKAGHLDGTSKTLTASNSSVRMSRPQSLKSRLSTPQGADYSTAPLPTGVSSAETGLADQPAEARTTENPAVSAYPTIGPPSPLRKSIRVPREPSLGATHVPATIKQTNSQSSWLVKAREAKAAEEGAKKVVTKPALPHYLAAGSKRKSGEMLATPPEGPEDQDQGRMQKLTKITGAPSLATLSKGHEKYTSGRSRDEAATLVDDSVREGATAASDSNGMIDKLKKTVAGFSARAGRSMGKSLGGAAATALAEARAAAEAKVAEREGWAVPAPHAVARHESSDPSHTATTSVLAPLPQTQATPEGLISGDKERRLSVSDLLSTSCSEKCEEVERVFQPPRADQPKTATATVSNTNSTANISTSTTPPNSPPKARSPVFTLPEKPKLLSAPIFFPPPLTQTFSRPELRPFGPPHVPQPLSAQSTLFSTQTTYPDTIFDHEIPAWVPSTQDTDLSDHGPSQSTLLKGGNPDGTAPEMDTDGDESWHLDEKFGETWSPVVIGMKDDSMTWSSVPTRSTHSAGTGNLDESVPPGQPTSGPAQGLLDTKHAAFEAIPSDNHPTNEVEEEDMDVELDEGVASIRLVTPAPQNKIIRSSTQSSGHQFPEEMQGSSNNVGGFFSSASKLVSSVLGGSKKGKEPVKSLQLAAIAAKKQQEEAEKKVNRLNQMEVRRQQVLQKKAEDDKAREEKKAHEEAERWKREREKDDISETKALKQPGRKLAQPDDDMAKKRKVPDTEKTAEPKKQPSKDKKDAPATRLGKFAPTSSQSGAYAPIPPSKAIKQGTATATQNSARTTVQTDAKTAIPTKAKERTKQKDVASKQPSQPVHSQMQKRCQVQIDYSQKGQVHPQPTSTESIELPDVNSEYSNSDDENRPRTFDPPDWAQSPELREALQSQSTVNPDDIFGAIRPLKMEELFKNRTSRFRARTSSANWAGADELTAHEEWEYARRMGYKT